MCKLCWLLLSAVLITALIAMFLLASGQKTRPASDGREIILLEPHQRDLVLAEMRGFVESLRDISQALGTDNSSQFQQASLKVGLAAQEGVPLDMMKALPLAFKKLGMDTHKKFDDLAASSQNGSSNEKLLLELSQLMNNCVACHAAFQLRSTEPAVNE